MKLLFDQNLSFRLCQQLSDQFPGSTQVRLVGLHQADDRTIWEYAKVNGFALVSLDSDFAEMAALVGPPPKVLWLRCGNQPTGVIEEKLREQSEAIAAFEHTSMACLERSTRTDRNYPPRKNRIIPEKSDPAFPPPT
jgi:predicted nuclease of predicted toxin-antitoxin system